MTGNDWKWLYMAGNFWKCLESGSNRPKCLKIANKWLIGFKAICTIAGICRLETVRNGLKRREMAGNGWDRLAMAGFDWKMAVNCCKLLEMTGNYWNLVENGWEIAWNDKPWWKWQEVAGNSWKWLDLPEMTVIPRNGWGKAWKWQEMTDYGWKVLEITGVALK